MSIFGAIASAVTGKSIFGSIAKAVVPALIGGAYTAKQNEKAAKKSLAAAKKASANRFVDLRTAAQKAGFNPLTALMAGGAPASPFMEPILSKGFIGDALTSGLGAALNYSENQASELAKHEREQLENEALRQEIAASKIMMSRSGSGFAYQIPQVEQSTLARPQAVQPTLVDPSVNRDIRLGGKVLKVNTDTDPVEVVETEYGGIAAEIVGFPKFVRDSLTSYSERLKEEWENLDLMPFDAPNVERVGRPLSTYQKKSQR